MNKQITFILYSFVLHLTLLLPWLFYWQPINKTFPLKSTVESSIQSYLYEEKQNEIKQPKRKEQQKKENRAIKKESTKGIIKPQKEKVHLKVEQSRKIAEKKAIVKKQNVQSVSQKSNPIKTVQLGELIHHAIQNSVIYPQSALQMEREGNARIGFFLTTDGNMRAIKLIKSSGTASLDTAALNAVQKVSPFIEAKNYIQQESYYEVEVVFKLT
jgi:TonB family protein